MSRVLRNFFAAIYPNAHLEKNFLDNCHKITRVAVFLFLRERQINFLSTNTDFCTASYSFFHAEFISNDLRKEKVLLDMCSAKFHLWLVRQSVSYTPKLKFKLTGTH